MKNLLTKNWMLAVLVALLPAVAMAETIEEAGLSNVECRVSRQDTGTGTITNRLRCRFDTVDASGTTVRRGASTGLGNLTPSQGEQIAACVDAAWEAIYSGEGFPVPTPRPTPAPTPHLPTPTPAP